MHLRILYQEEIGTDKSASQVFFLLPEHQLASLAMEGWRLLLSQFLVALASSVGAEASDAARWRILLEI